MIRRIIGICHVEDLDGIENIEIKAKCEIKVLKFARDLMVNRMKYNHIKQIIQLATVYNTPN